MKPSLPQPAKEAWHSLAAGEVLIRFGSTVTGHSAQEAAKRLAEHGPNELREAALISAWTIFLGQFKNLIVWILIVAGVVSGVLGEVVDAIAILAIVVLNAVIGFYQEFSAEKSIAALRKMTAPSAKVVPAAEVVPGDILELAAGDLWLPTRGCSKPPRCAASSLHRPANLKRWTNAPPRSTGLTCRSATAAIVAGLPMPLLAIHLLWINLVTDGLPALCLATDPIDPGVMKQPPCARHERITDGGFLRTMFLTGALTAGVSFAVYLYALKFETPEMARTHAFAALVFAALLRSFGARIETRPLWRMNLFSNLNLLVVVAISFSIQIWSHHNAILAKFLKTSLISFSNCLMLLAVSTVPLLVLEARKVFIPQRMTPLPA